MPLTYLQIEFPQNTRNNVFTSKKTTNKVLVMVLDIEKLKER